MGGTIRLGRRMVSFPVFVVCLVSGIIYQVYYLCTRTNRALGLRTIAQTRCTRRSHSYNCIYVNFFWFVATRIRIISYVAGSRKAKKSDRCNLARQGEQHEKIALVICLVCRLTYHTYVLLIAGSRKSHEVKYWPREMKLDASRRTVFSYRTTFRLTVKVWPVKASWFFKYYS